MRQLDPKAFWLFFFQFLSIFGVIGVILIMSFMPVITGTLLLSKGLTDSLFSAFSTWGWLFLAVIVWIVFCYIWAKLSYRFWRYQIAEDAIRIEKGVIWKKYISIPYERIQNVDIYRGILARILGLSDLQIQTAGYSGGYGRYGRGESEGKLPGINIRLAEQLRDELIKKAKGTKQGL